jgi:hypothetical protein
MMLAYLATALLAVATVYSAIVSFRQKPEDAAPSWIFPEQTRRPSKIAVSVVTFLLVIGWVAWFSVSPRNSTPRSLRFLISEGHTGWVRVEFEVPGAPPLPVEAGKTVLRIPPSGVLETSSPEQYGWAKDEYFFYSSTGSRRLPDSGPQRLIWGKINGEASGTSGKRKYEEFFVGNQQQFKEQINGWQPTDPDQKARAPATVP